MLPPANNSQSTIIALVVLAIFSLLHPIKLEAQANNTGTNIQDLAVSNISPSNKLEPGASRTAPEGTYEDCIFPSEPKEGNDQLHYKWLKPLDQRPGEKYPLLICLHGRGGGIGCSGLLLQPIMRQKYPAFIMMPRADQPAVWTKLNVTLKEGAPPALTGPEKYSLLMEAVRSLVRSEAIDPSRIYITGQSMGGIGTWGAIARNPEMFAAAVPICGAWNPADAPKMKAVPIWAFHGEKDPTVPVHWSRDLIDAVKKAGGTARYTEYPDVGHDSWTKAYLEADMWKWLFDQRLTGSRTK